MREWVHTFMEAKESMSNETAFSRSARLVGQAAIGHLATCKVAIFGLGGVGSFAAEGLARAGIGHLLLVDHDTISISNLNRQLVALHSTIGQPKVEVMKSRILDINHAADVSCLQQFYLPGQADQLLTADLDYIVDAIDTVSAKLDLAVEATRRGIPIISCMGAGNKLDPTAFEVADLFSTSNCPLARVMRRELRQRGVTALKVVYSRETPLQPIENRSVAGTDDSDTLRRHIPGSIPFVPPVAGFTAAGEVVKDLIRDYTPART